MICQDQTGRYGVLSQIDLRNTARVLCCRDFLFNALQQQKSLFEGEHSAF